MKKAGIHLRLLLAAVLLIVATTLALGTIGVKTIHQFVRTRFDERIQFLAHYLALNTELGILIDERETLERLARNLLEEVDVVRVVILNEKDEVLTDISRPGKSAYPYHTVEVPVLLKTDSFEMTSFPGEGITWNQAIGSVRVMYTTEGIDLLLKTMKQRLLWIAVGLCSLAIVIFYFLSRSLVAPITKIAKAARNYASGNLDMRPVPENLPETRELTLAFNSMLDSIEWSNRALEDAYQEMIQQNTLAELGKFSMMVAHEFKNPLSIIKGSITRLKKEQAGALDGSVMVRYMEEEIHRLNRLIEDFLMFSKPLKPVFRSTDLNEALSSCLKRNGLIAQASSIEMTCTISSDPCIVNADRDLLMRVMDNLMKNALEASKKNGCIHVTALRIEGFWELKVRDEGDGVPEKNQERIFEAFFTTKSKGSGLGLAFARQVVKAHNGSIRAENVEGGGACFTVCLPLNESFSTTRKNEYQESM